MAERTGGGNMFLAFAVGALLIAVLGIGWMVWSGGMLNAPQAPKVDLEVKLPSTPSLPSPSPNPAPAPTPAPIPKPG